MKVIWWFADSAQNKEVLGSFPATSKLFQRNQPIYICFVSVYSQKVKIIIAVLTGTKTEPNLGRKNLWRNVKAQILIKTAHRLVKKNIRLNKSLAQFEIRHHQSPCEPNFAVNPN